MTILSVYITCYIQHLDYIQDEKKPTNMPGRDKLSRNEWSWLSIISNLDKVALKGVKCWLYVMGMCVTVEYVKEKTYPFCPFSSTSMNDRMYTLVGRKLLYF